MSFCLESKAETLNRPAPLFFVFFELEEDAPDSDGTAKVSPPSKADLKFKFDGGLYALFGLGCGGDREKPSGWPMMDILERLIGWLAFSLRSAQEYENEIL